MISCSDFVAEIGNYLEDDVAAAVRLELENHLAHCQACQVVYDSSRKTLKVVTDSGSFDLPETVFEPIAAEIMTRIRCQAESAGESQP